MTAKFIFSSGGDHKAIDKSIHEFLAWIANTKGCTGEPGDTVECIAGAVGFTAGGLYKLCAVGLDLCVDDNEGDRIVFDQGLSRLFKPTRKEDA